jgi:hypothetical protein
MDRIPVLVIVGEHRVRTIGCNCSRVGAEDEALEDMGTTSLYRTLRCCTRGRRVGDGLENE